MREYATVSARFWMGDTGRKLRGDADAQRVAFYLMTCPSSSMIGLYYLPLPTMCHELGIPFEGALKALRRVQEVGFASYDEETEWVWVHEMARFQIADSLEPKDNRVKSVNRQFSDCANCRFAKDFHDRYQAAFHLAPLQVREPKPEVKPSPFEAPSKPLRSQEQEQEQELKNTAPESGTENPDAETSPNEAPAPAATKPKSHGVFDWIKAEDLRDIGKIIAWHNRVSKCKSPVIGPTEADRLTVVAAAVHTWSHAEDPHKLFSWIIGKKQFGGISGADEDTAHKMITEYLHGKSKPPRAGKAESVADTIKGLFPEAGVLK